MSGKVQSTLKEAQDKAKTIDEQKGFSKVAHEVGRTTLFSELVMIKRIQLQYYSKAISSPFGKSVLDFYTNTSKQVRDIHEEARRMVDQHEGQPASPPSSGATGSDAQPTPTTQAAPTVV